MIPSGYKESLLNFGISEEKADSIVQMAKDLAEWEKDNNNHFDIESSVKSEIEAFKNVGIVIRLPFWLKFERKLSKARYILKKIIKKRGISDFT